MRSELQYNLQKARALATELRCTLEAVEEENEDVLDTSRKDFWADRLSITAGEIESFLDETPKSIIGEGHVALNVEPFQ